jgi:hypothetical protein
LYSTRRLLAVPLAAVSCVVLLALGAGSASARIVAVSDLGQPGMVSTVPQPPLGLVSRGSCSEPRTLAEANGGGSPCPGGTWPASGQYWAPQLRVASGDTVAFDFATEPDQVLVVATTNFPPNATAPDPTNVEFGPIEAQVTDDPKRWVATVPSLEHAVPVSTAPASVAVTAIGDTGAENYALSFMTPRFAEHGSDCGNAWFVPGPPGFICPHKALPPGVPWGFLVSMPDATVPTVKLTELAGVLRRRAVRLGVRASVAGTLRVRLSWRGRVLGRGTRQLARGGKVTVRIRTSKREAAVLRRRGWRLVRVHADLRSSDGVSLTRLSRVLRVRTRGRSSSATRWPEQRRRFHPVNRACGPVSSGDTAAALLIAHTACIHAGWRQHRRPVRPISPEIALPLCRSRRKYR